MAWHLSAASERPVAVVASSSSLLSLVPTGKLTQEGSAIGVFVVGRGIGKIGDHRHTIVYD